MTESEMDIPRPRWKLPASVMDKVKTQKTAHDARNKGGSLAESSDGSGGGPEIAYVVKRTPPKAEEQQVTVSSLPANTSLDHTHDTFASSAVNSAERENIPGMKGNKPPGPGSVEYSMAPRSKKISVQTDGQDVLCEFKNSDKYCGRTPRKLKHSNKDNDRKLTTISMPDEKYFTKRLPATPTASPKIHRTTLKIDRTSSHEFSIGASTITSAPDMPPAPTELTQDTDDTSKSDEWSRSLDSRAPPPMSTIGMSDSTSRFSHGSSMSSRLRHKRISKVKETLLKDIHDEGVSFMRVRQNDMCIYLIPLVWYIAYFLNSFSHPILLNSALYASLVSHVSIRVAIWR